jgi:hypothetical protein
MVLTEDTSQIAAREEYTPASIVTLNAGLFAEVRAYHVNLHGFGTNEAVSSFLITIDTTEARAEIAVF